METPKEFKLPIPAPSIILVMGAPASGKNAVAKAVAEKFGYKHLAMGEAIAQKTAIDPAFAEVLNGSDHDAIFKALYALIPDGKVVVSGFPQNEDQAARLIIDKLSRGLSFHMIPLPYQDALKRASEQEGFDQASFDARYKKYEGQVLPIHESLVGTSWFTCGWWYSYTDPQKTANAISEHLENNEGLKPAAPEEG